MTNYILAIDQGTTSTRAVILNSKTWDFVSSHQIELPQHFPNPSWVEHDLNDIWSHTKECIKGALEKAKIQGKEISAIGITNQRETTCAYDKLGNPLARAIVWQDKRTSSFCVKNKSHSNKLKSVTGLPLDPYFSATKMQWLLKNNERVSNAAAKNNLCLSTIDTYLLYKLSGTRSFKTDATNASRTLLYNLKSANWDDKLLSFFKIKREYLPEVCDTFYNFGKTYSCDVLPDGIPILCLIGDQQSALLGQHCTLPGMSKCTYGTGAFLLVNTGDKILKSKNGLLTTVAFSYQKKNFFALEGASFIAGAGVQWFRDQLNGIKTSQEIEALALKVKNLSAIESLFFFPFFSGLGSPYWRSDALACIYGMSRGTGLAELSYVLLDGIAQCIADLKEAVEADIGKKLKSFHVDGGAAKNNLLMQIQANYLNLNINRPTQLETTVMGAALGANLQLNNLAPSTLAQSVKLEKDFYPQKNVFFKNRRRSWKNKIKKLYL